MLNDSNTAVLEQNSFLRPRLVENQIENQHRVFGEVETPVFSQAGSWQGLRLSESRTEISDFAHLVLLTTLAFSGQTIPLVPVKVTWPKPVQSAAIIDQLQAASRQVKKSAWDVLASMIGTVDAPADWATEHDHYLYGTPKRG